RSSGLLGLSGLGSDLRELEVAAGEGHPGAALAIGVFCYRLAGKVLAMCAPLSGLDALVFTGGIGENSPLVRRLTLERLGLLGLLLDEAANRDAVGGRSGLVSPPRHRPATLVVHTDEERMIACEAARVLGRGTPAAEETP
ncbi:MAG: acetate kinase, partial [Deinococcus sp.]